MFRAASALIGRVWGPDVHSLRKEPAGLEQGSERLLGLGTQLDTLQANSLARSPLRSWCPSWKSAPGSSPLTSGPWLATHIQPVDPGSHSKPEHSA